MKRSFYGLAVEGWPLVLLLAGLTAWLAFSPWPLAAVLAGALMVFAALQFRDPPRTVPADPRGVISPVDGVVSRAEQDAGGVRVLLRIATFSPYLLRSPIEGKVLEPDRANGGPGVTIRSDEGDAVQLRLAGPRWLPPAAIIGYGQRIGQGQRCGMLRASRLAELRLPADARLLVSEGERVVAGETVLARFHAEGSIA